MADTVVPTPIPISFVAGRYLLYDSNAITFLRREHRICGVLIGTLPQAPSQNVFLGVPLELMPEEARLLVENNVGYLVDDVKAHLTGLGSMSKGERAKYFKFIQEQEASVTRAAQQKSLRSKERTLRKKAAKAQASEVGKGEAANVIGINRTDSTERSEEGSILPSDLSPIPSSLRPPARTGGYHVTPTTSDPPVPPPPPSDNALPLIAVPPSYPLFEHLHARGYFISPGLRFGCQYMVYPGDSLRYHSHFLASGLGWNEEFSLLDLVAGGRLGTGVKKGYLIGGQVEEEEKHSDRVKTFCIEWAGM
ncbi:hypothetical protein BDY21DRAFT_283197 [Lineolata rhizophorae]|uniref:tRNA-splicing endonuclease subunit Sen34 n=1 Tax=Lineolata rhizophorae TaxID=578093 RepID=A0A6A6P5G7_9PEZI|nr:hypothetical protein BDY21DRAFT_283197 [Lineolata rhizophorae]